MDIKPNELFKFLSDENRLNILVMLLIDDYCVCDMERFLGLKQANISKHLMGLRKANIVTTNKEFMWVHYSIHKSFIENNGLLIDYLKETALYQYFVSELKTFQKDVCKPKWQNE